MTQPRVIIPRISVSFEDTRQLFGLSASEAARAARLVDFAFEGSRMRVTARAERNRKATATSAPAATARKVKKARAAARRK